MSAPITITGNLVADPELKFINNGKALATFTVVSSKSTKNPDGTWENTDTTFWDIKAWGKTAENCADSLGKGVSVIVVGTAVQENWDDKNTGAKRSKITVTAWNVGVDMKRHTIGQVSTVTRSEASTAFSEPDPWAKTLSQDAPPF
jgi:single-strand DNA-binding protein